MPAALLPGPVYAPTEGVGQIEDAPKCEITTGKIKCGLIIGFFVAPAQPHLWPASPPVSSVYLPAAR